jgi:hypothetical protein
MEARMPNQKHWGLAFLLLTILLLAKAAWSESPAAGGFDIQGLKLGMTTEDLPLDFRNLPQSPSGFSTASAYKKCEGDDRCTEIRFDNTVSPPRIYAVLVDDLPLGRNQDSETAVTLLTNKYGPPSSRSGSFTMIVGILSWGTTSDFANLGAPDYIHLGALEAVHRLIDAKTELTPDGPERGFRDFLVAMIAANLFGVHGASLWLIDAPSAIRVRERSDQLLAERKNELPKRDTDSTAKPKL